VQWKLDSAKFDFQQNLHMDLALSRRSTKYRRNQIWWQMPELNPPIWYRLLPILGELSKVYKNHDIYFESLIVSDIRDRKDSTKQPPTRSTHGQPHHQRLLMCSKLPFLRFFPIICSGKRIGALPALHERNQGYVHIIDGYTKDWCSDVSFSSFRFGVSLSDPFRK